MTKLPKKSKAAVLVAQKAPLKIIEIDLPRDLCFGQVLVELHYSGICGSQIGEIDGVKGEDKWLPHLLGHEGSGQVLAAGPGVTNVNVGDHVVLHWRKSIGIESETPTYTSNGNAINAGWVTTFNEYAVVSENRLTKIHNDYDMRAAALFGCAITTGFGTIDFKSELKLGQSVVVFGSGGVGLSIIQAASLAGASEIVAVDLFENRLSLARQFGATKFINSSVDNAWGVLNQIFLTKKADIFIDNTGNPEIISRGYEILTATGKLILVGVPKKGANASLYTLDLHFGKTIIGTHGGDVLPSEGIPRYMSLLESRKIDPLDLITRVGELSDINKLIEEMRDGTTAGRCLVKLKK